jgi:MFS family permease
MLTAGALADRFGRRVTFAAGTVIFTAGSLLCGLATGPLNLALSRAGQGRASAARYVRHLARAAQRRVPRQGPRGRVGEHRHEPG